MSVVIEKMNVWDRQEVRDLYASVFGERAWTAWEARRHWQFVENPAAAERPAKLLVARVNGVVRGFIAGMPVRIKIGDDIHTVLLPCDLAASPEGRGYNLGWRLTRAVLKDAGVLGCSLAQSETARKLYDVLRWQSLDLAPPAWRPRDASALAKKVLGVGLPGGRWLGAMLDRMAWPKLPADRTIETVAHPSEELDALWSSASREHTIVGVRNRSFALWRFFGDPMVDHDFIEARRGGSLVGWTAVAVVNRNGLSFGKIMDIFCSPGDDASVRALLRGALEALAVRGAAVCAIKGLHPKIRACVERHFPLRRTGFPARIDWRGDPKLADIVGDARGWHATHADGDEDMAP